MRLDLALLTATPEPRQIIVLPRLLWGRVLKQREKKEEKKASSLYYHVVYGWQVCDCEPNRVAEEN